MKFKNTFIIKEVMAGITNSHNPQTQLVGRKAYKPPVKAPVANTTETMLTGFGLRRPKTDAALHPAKNALHQSDFLRIRSEEHIVPLNTAMKILNAAVLEATYLAVGGAYDHVLVSRESALRPVRSAACMALSMVERSDGVDGVELAVVVVVVRRYGEEFPLVVFLT